MANTFYLKRGDTYPDMVVQLLNEDDEPVNLTGATVLGRISEPSSGNLMIERAADVITQTGDDIGKISFEWEDGDSDILGTYRVEWRVTFSNGKIATFPRGSGADLYNQLIIQEIVD